VGYQHVPGPELRIVKDVIDGIDGAAHDAGLVEDLRDLRPGELARPVGDQALDLILILAPGGMRDEALVVGQGWLTHRGAQSPKNTVLVGCDHDPASVLGGEKV